LAQALTVSPWPPHLAFEWPSWTAMLPMKVWLLAFDLLIVASGDQSESSVLLQGRPQESPTETKQQQRLHEAQELELEAEKNATSLFDQLEKKSQEAKANAHNTALAARSAKLLTSAVDGALAGLRKQAQASIESSLASLGDAVTNLTSNHSVVTDQAIRNVQSKFEQVQQKMKALQELNNDELMAVRKGYELARRREENNAKSLAKEVSRAVKAWKRAGHHNLKEQIHAGVPEHVYEKHYGEVEHSSEHLMDKVSDLRTDVELGIEKFFEHVEMHVEAFEAEKQNEFNSKLNEYDGALLQSQSRFEKAAMKTYSSQPASVGALRGGGRPVQLKSTAGATASPTAMTEAAAMMYTANSWFGIQMLVIACLSGSVLVFIVDHLRFRLHPRNPVLAPLMIG